ncbi:MAG: response regulator transcription factor [Nocardioidaceae bacterium]|nr:response regulator transcription factor [Nocardioidaceae bacterium]
MRILVVDDDVRVTAAVKRGLEHEGYSVDVSADGAEGLWLAEENRYDALVLDSMLPGLAGEELCERLRKAGDWTPVLILTARVGERDEAHALDAGADDYLAKPFSMVVLRARIRALVRRPAVERPTVLAAGDLRLDPAAHRVWRGETEIVLTPRQFAVLEFLMRHPGEVLSKRAILENVWDFTFDGDPNIVEVNVRQVRLKVDRPFGRDAIETVRLVGYRLHPEGG